RRPRDVRQPPSAAGDDRLDGPRRADRAARDPRRRGDARPEPRDLRHADAEGHLRPRDVRELVPDDGARRVGPRPHAGDHAPFLVPRLRGGVRRRPLRAVGQGRPQLDTTRGGLMYGTLRDDLVGTLAEVREAGLYKSELEIT